MGIVEDVWAALDLREPDEAESEHVTYSAPSEPADELTFYWGA